MKRILIAGNIKGGDVQESLRFIERISAVGGVPAVGAALNGQDAAALAEAFDAVILTGGFDIPPERFGQEPHRSNRYDDPLRDASDERIARAFIAAGKRLAGICRGCQAVNVWLGGTLHQHLPDAFDPVLWHANNILGRHNASITEGSMLASILGAGLVRVNSSHHQAIDRPGDGLAVCATAPDGVVEAVEGKNILLIQWHPEYMDGEHDALFKWLLG
ncbi:MAG: gamma-glutamyl-gamma-aminobutyrate hydrolase family protein [Oscillospiraceae bacterium]|jgi:gamma-glutamyl-gamma-aminobutyrate hydrolase PuuD|nr:gamma-glutamyl-gamma-aminobutyrate hydrolase family protein [Oscillospiraceae bacterium]